MPQHRKTYTASRARRTSRQVHESTIGTHVVRPGASQSRTHARNQAFARRARIRRAIIGIVAVVAVAGIAVAAGFLAFRGVLGGELTLRDSDAKDALVAVKSSEPSYTLVTVELGAVAQPLDTAGPDVILLMRLDSQDKTIALVNVPTGLQITYDNQSDSIASIASKSDAAAIEALSTLAKIDISHIVKIQSEDDVKGLVSALGGVQVDVRQEIDDPHAGSVCIKTGNQTLEGDAALTFLRATNLEYGLEDRSVNQLDFAAQVLSKVFSNEGSLATRLDAIAKFLQTDYSLGDIESIGSWLGGVEVSAISTAVLPGYYTVSTNAASTDESRYISTSSEVAELIGKLEGDEHVSASSIGSADLVSPSSFTVSVQNGTTIEGAASSVASLLKAAGFKVGDVGNAETPIYEETIVVYKGNDDLGLSRAKTVIEELGVGRAVDASAYYTFDSDVLLIIGADNKPVA